MELMQLNMWQGRLAGQVIKLVDEREPDIITAQELYRGGDTVLAPENMFSLYEKVAARYPYHAFAAVNALAIARGKAEMGTAIFSRHPITSASHFFTHGEYVDGISVGTDVHNSRTLQTVSIAIEDRTLQVLTHHGHWVKSAMGDKTSIEKMHIIADHIRALDQTKPIIFAGDLNVVPESPAMRAFDGLLTDLVTKYEVKNTLSSIHKLGNVACDHILVNQAVTVKHLQELDVVVSDHKPLVLGFSV